MKPKKSTPAGKARERIIKRAAAEFKNGMYGEFSTLLKNKIHNWNF